MRKPYNAEQRPKLQLMPRGANSLMPALSGSMKVRLRNQLTRAFTNSFGSENGLRELAMLATTQMLKSGNTRTTIREALTQCVLEHPAAGGGAGRLTLHGKTRADTLTALLIQWSDLTEPA